MTRYAVIDKLRFYYSWMFFFFFLFLFAFFLGLIKNERVVHITLGVEVGPTR